MNNNILFQTKIPLPKYRTKSKKTKKYTEVLCTLNTISKWYRYSKTKIKNDYKTILKELSVPEPTMQYDSILIEYRIIRHTKQNIDKDNVVFALKWLSDLLEELGYIKNDNVVNFSSFDTTYDLSAEETMLEIRVINSKNEW